MDKYSFLNSAHTAYFAELYDQYLKNPDAVEPSWRAFFQGFDFGIENFGFNIENFIFETKNLVLKLKILFLESKFLF